MKPKPYLLSLDAFLVGLTMTMSLVVISLSAFAVTASPPRQVAQAAAPQADPPPSVPAGKQDGPAESKPGGTRPTTPPPEPATPSAAAQKAGAMPALPPAPAEKTGPPITEKPVK